MGAIYLRDGDDFVAMHEAKYDAEAVLQSLLAEHPEVLAGGESTSGWVLVRREAGIPDAADAGNRWALDHLFLDARGVPTLVEVKRSSDTRARREVVAQMLEYAANATAFWRVELLRSWFEDETTRAGSAAAEMLLATLGVEDEDAFWSTVQTNLAADRIRLVFVADEIAAELPDDYRVPESADDRDRGVCDRGQAVHRGGRITPDNRSACSRPDRGGPGH